MKEKAHFNPKSLTWIISLVAMIIVSAAVVLGAIGLDNLANKKYNEPIAMDFTITATKDVDISSTNAGDYNIKSVKEAYDANNTLVGYIVEGTTVGYNQESPILMNSIISADGTVVWGIEVLEQEETEYLGVRIQTPEFQNQFTGRYLPVIASGSTSKGSTIDTLSKATISSQAVIDAVNNAQNFVCDNYVTEETE